MSRCRRARPAARNHNQARREVRPASRSNLGDPNHFDVAHVHSDGREVGTAVDRLREAVAALDDERDSDAERTPTSARNCWPRRWTTAAGTGTRTPARCAGPSGSSDEVWAKEAAEQVAALRQEAAAARRARTGLQDAVDAVRYFVTPVPAWLPPRSWTRGRSGRRAG